MEVRVDEANLFFYISGMKVLDYLIKWDYIST